MKGRTQKYLDTHPKAKAKQRAYNKEYQKKPSAVVKRVEANRANRKAQKNGTAKVGDHKDYDHAVQKMVPQAINRGRAEKSRLKGSSRSL